MFETSFAGVVTPKESICRGHIIICVTSVCFDRFRDPRNPS